jgi:BASS family bile acid:Na+ symporter
MLLLILKTSIAALILAVGISAVTDDIVYLWRRPVLLVKSVVAMYLVMPAVAILMARVFDLPERTELALVILAICAGAPLQPTLPAVMLLSWLWPIFWHRQWSRLPMYYGLKDATCRRKTRFSV